MPDATTIEWLLEGDAAVRWQVLRDLLDAPDDVVAGERARVATTGWGARLLAHQDPEGTWAHALYSPKWTSTTYTLLLLAQLGLPEDDPRARTGCEVLLARARSHDGGLNLARTVREPGLTRMVFPPRWHHDHDAGSRDACPCFAVRGRWLVGAATPCRSPGLLARCSVDVVGRVARGCGDVRPCGGDRGRWSDRADAGGRVNAGGGRRGRHRAARQ